MIQRTKTSIKRVIEKLRGLKSPKALSYSVLGLYILLALFSALVTIRSMADWTSYRDSLTSWGALNIYHIQSAEMQLQLISFTSIATAVLITLSVKLWTRILSDGKNVRLNLLSTILLASPLALFGLPQPWSWLAPAVLVASSILIDRQIDRKQP
ncbi:hypothetical protein [Arthrobacter psychrochitiniphilus]|uniref:Uncharacterized protein n=1 Tax=Arthrobacter psychrochitiniphilus TaxID=291045 RepID=A0A2V3DLR9_9MICC|nr:hypothetical protein [Arthrobacter psychrochitiniphilus]NYG16073.1 hypothetical protein [Arthrobacter psychrochitiniphilus]PXA63883.1 hypothetical protein CVS29_18025 [Arthrobacter psychrochitiniphilus]